MATANRCGRKRVTGVLAPPAQDADLVVAAGNHEKLLTVRCRNHDSADKLTYKSYNGSL